MSGKYVKHKEKKTGKSILILVILCAVLAAAIIAVPSLARSAEPVNDNIPPVTNGPEANQPTVQDELENSTEEVPSATEEALIRTEIETKYLNLQFPEKYMNNLVHQEVIEGDTAMEVFSMKTAETTLELFRIYFNDAEVGRPLGSWHVDGKEIPVTLSVCEYQENVFADEQNRELYYSMMDSMNMVLDAIFNDTHFVGKAEAIIETVESKMTYWNVSLPENISWEETETEDTYIITFYGSVKGTDVKLFAVALGEAQLKNVLGIYTSEDVIRTVSVENYDLPETDNWEESAVTELYKMMESINDVIEVITSSENFSAELPKA